MGKLADSKNKGGKKLTPKEQRFVEEYMVDLNATAAATRAGYQAKNSDSMRVIASRLLTKVHIQSALSQKVNDVSAGANTLAERAVKEITRLSFSDFRKLFDENGNMKPIDQIDDDTAAAVASVEVFEEYEGRGENKTFLGYTKKIKLWDKNAALDKLFRYLSLYKDPGSKESPINHTMTVIFKDAE